MLYRSYTPAPPLSEFIDRFWLCHDTSPNLKERILPSGTIELVINLREDEVRIYDPLRPERCKRFSGAVVSGTYSGCFVIDPAQHASILGSPADSEKEKSLSKRHSWALYSCIALMTGGCMSSARPTFHPYAVRYQIKDVDRAVEFYTRHLGFKLKQHQGPAFARVSFGELQLWLSGPGSSGAAPCRMDASRNLADGTGSFCRWRTWHPAWHR